MKTYGPKMKCLVDPNMDYFGNFDTDKAQNLMIVFEICDKTKRTCKTDTEITEWLRFKYIVTLENERKFI